MRRPVYCTASFSVCSLRRAKFPIIYPDLQLDYKVATHTGESLPIASLASMNPAISSRSQLKASRMILICRMDLYRQ